MKKVLALLISLSPVIAKAQMTDYVWSGTDQRTGDIATGQFTIDDSAPLSAPNRYQGGIKNMSLTFGGQVYTHSPGWNLEIIHQPLLQDTLAAENVYSLTNDKNDPEFHLGFSAPYGTFKDGSLANADNVDKTPWSFKEWALDFASSATAYAGKIINIYKKADLSRKVSLNFGPTFGTSGNTCN
jgi:hypothetical protein